MSEGYIYIMTNPCLHDMVKIGYASDVEARRKQLSTTALPFEYEIYATYETSGQLEDKKLHELIDTLNPKLRLAKNREFEASGSKTRRNHRRQLKEAESRLRQQREEAKAGD